MTQLYTPEGTLRWKKRAAFLLALALLLLVLALLVCIGLCMHVTTGNASSMLAAVVIISVLAGWGAMLLIFFGSLPARALWRHAQGLADGEKEDFTGMLQVDKHIWQIPHSVTFYKATLTKEDGGTVLLHAACHVKKALPEPDMHVRVEAVRKFVTAWEAADEKE